MRKIFGGDRARLCARGLPQQEEGAAAAAVAAPARRGEAGRAKPIDVPARQRGQGRRVRRRRHGREGRGRRRSSRRASTSSRSCSTRSRPSAAPIELLNGVPPARSVEEAGREVRQAQGASTTSSSTLDDGVKKLRAFKAGLGEASGRLGNLKGELDRLMLTEPATRARSRRFARRSRASSARRSSRSRPRSPTRSRTRSSR